MFFPENAFYGPFDLDLFDPDGRGRRDDPHRSPFEIDRDRIVHSGAFRRLQGKTQVLLAGEYDFYRTRLTHSIEVAQIGRAICTRLQRTSSLVSDEFHVSDTLVEAACLTHDLGHPPFGHAGERTLNALLSDLGGFEGNAQTLHILTRDTFDTSDGPRGIRPTRALMDAVLKYKVTHADSEMQLHHFVYDAQREELAFVLDDRAEAVLALPEEELNAFRSIECQIMNWADDIAYSVHDVADGYRAGFLTAQNVERWVAEDESTGDAVAFAESLVAALRDDRIEPFLAGCIGEFIRGCDLIETTNPMTSLTNRYRYALAPRPEARAAYGVLTRLARALMFDCPQITQLEAKGDLMLRRLFTFLDDAYGLTADRPTPRPLLPADVHQRVVDAQPGRARAAVVRNNLSGMTDAHAIRFYRRLFDATFGSLTDLV